MEQEELKRFYKMACLSDQVSENELGTQGDIELILSLGEDGNFDGINSLFNKHGKYTNAEELLDCWIGISLDELNRDADLYGYMRVS